MKEPIALGIDEVLARRAEFASLLDARSPSEFLEDHLPGAISTPVLDDQQRALVGTVYKQQSSFEAKRLGAALVSRNIGDILQTQLADRPRDWTPLVYCWRGGNRSGALATVLARIGWRVYLLVGGYREFRRRVISDLNVRPDRLRFKVLAGRTGSAKSELLRRLHRAGAQVLDLEALANHRGSVLGLMPGTTQPSQKHFETLIWEQLQQFSAERPVWVEAESRRIGQCHLPDSVIHAIRASSCVRVEAPLAVRARLLLNEYAHFTEQTDELQVRLERLAQLHGHAQIERWTAQISAAQWQDFVASLLEHHYDPAYDRSMLRNYSALQSAPVLEITSPDESSLSRATQTLLEMDP